MSKYPNGCKVTTKNSESCKANEINLLCNEGISQIYLASELIIHEVVHDCDVFHLYASSSLDYGICPYCGHVSSQVHSRYSRTIYDLSILGERVVLHLDVRKFFCHNDDCCRKTFAEQPGDEVFRYRRRTCRCERVVARQITEVADKFHLVKNITDRMTKLVAENYADYRQAVRSNEEGQVKTTETTNVPLVTKHPSPKPDSRCVVFNEVKEIQQKGFKPTTIAKKLGIARQTATKYYNMDSLPERNSKLRNEYYKYDAYVEQEAINGKPLSAIHNEICKMGFSGSLTPFYEHYKYLSDGHRGYRSKNWKPDAKKEKPKDNRSELLPLRSIASVIDMALKGKNMDKSQQTTFDILMSLGWFTEMYEALKSFCKVIKGCETVELVRWMKKYWNTTISSLKTFIIGIKRDFQAVRNTIRLNITNYISDQ